MRCVKYSRTTFRPALILAGMITGCAYNPPVRSPDLDVLEVVYVNHEQVWTQGNDNVLDLLRRKVAAFRLGERAPLVGEQPLVVVDGVLAVDGVRTLAGIPAFHAESIETIHPPQAMARYGAMAVRGAILVTTRRR
jgi:hypothetical protein